MTAAGRERLAGLEGQVAELAAEVRDLRAQAFVVRTLEETMIRLRMGGAVPATASRRPRHLHSAGGSAS